MRRMLTVLGLAFATTFVAGCGILILGPGAADAVGREIHDLAKSNDHGTDEIRMELNSVTEKLQQFKQPDGSYKIPAADGAALQQEIGKLKEKDQKLSD